VSASLEWSHPAADWPHAERSRFIEADDLRWHVQQWPTPHAGAATLLLLHGTGASGHSFRSLAPVLAERYALIVPDLPGHAFSGPARPGGASMPAMAHGVHALLAALGQRADVIVGHSAGAAIAVRMALEPWGKPGVPGGERGQGGPACIIGLNAALLPLRGIAGALFSPAAKLLARSPWAPEFFARRASDRVVLARLLDSTGSTIDAEGTALYRRLVASPAHVAGALAMMAQWDLPALAADLPRLRTPLHLIAGSSDRTIPPDDAYRVQSRVPGTSVLLLPGLGHLAHEEAPVQVAAAIAARVDEALLPA
jgi:magnesium chelatase accessory protein